MLLKAKLNASKQKYATLQGKVHESDGKMSRKGNRYSTGKQDRTRTTFKDLEKGKTWSDLSPMLNTKEKWGIFMNGNNSTLGKNEVGHKIKGKWYFWCVHCEQ